MIVAYIQYIYMFLSSDGWMDVRMDVRMGGWIDRCMDGLVDVHFTVTQTSFYLCMCLLEWTVIMQYMMLSPSTFFFFSGQPFTAILHALFPPLKKAMSCWAWMACP